MKPVIIESPYAGDVVRNMKYLNLCIYDCIVNHNEAPYASHKLYTDSLDDTVKEERDLGIEAGFVWRTLAEKTVVYVDFGISTGMKYGIEHAEKHGHPVEHRRLPAELLLQVAVFNVDSLSPQDFETLKTRVFKRQWREEHPQYALINNKQGEKE